MSFSAKGGELHHLELALADLRSQKLLWNGAWRGSMGWTSTALRATVDSLIQKGPEQLVAGNRRTRQA